MSNNSQKQKTAGVAQSRPKETAMTKRPTADGQRCPECNQIIKPELKKAARKNGPADEYIATWKDLIASGTGDLVARWEQERDQRDELLVPIADRLDLLRLIAPEEVLSSAEFYRQLFAEPQARLEQKISEDTIDPVMASNDTGDDLNTAAGMDVLQRDEIAAESSNPEQ
jgi:hypothetical protein